MSAMQFSFAPRHFLLTTLLAVGTAFACKKGPSESAAAATATRSSTYGTDQLGYFIGSATKAERSHTDRGGPAPHLPIVDETLDSAKVTALLAKLDLKQVPSGNLAKCIGRQGYAFFDTQGNKLGSITFDGCPPRFDSPDGKVKSSISANLSP